MGRYTAIRGERQGTQRSELLAEHEGVTLSPGSIGRTLRAAGLKGRKAKRRSRHKHHYATVVRRLEIASMDEANAALPSLIKKRNEYFWVCPTGRRERV